MVSIPISTNIVKTIANLRYYLYSDNGNKQYRRIQTNKTSKRQRERRARLTTELRNMDRSSNSEQHRQMSERRISEETEQHRSTNSEKEDNHDHNNLVSYQCMTYCVIENATPVDCPRVSLVCIITSRYNEVK